MSSLPGPKLSKAHWLSLGSLILTVIGIFWFVSTIVPVLWIEVKYQSRVLLTEVFRVDDLRGLVIPTITFNDPSGNSKHTDYALVIPRIYLDEPVIFNVDPNDEKAYSDALKKGIAHASSTSFPDRGGVGYYFAHSSNPSFRRQLNAVFYLLGKLEPNDQVFIWHEGKQYAYRVSGKKITSPKDVSFLREELYDSETVVLQTCWPPGSDRERMLVFAQRVEE